MKDTVRFSLNLFTICFISSGLLTVVNSLTYPLILSQRILKEESDLKIVLPEAEVLKPYSVDEEVLYYEAFDARGGSLGYIAKAEAKGYAGDIVTFFSMDRKGAILKIKVSSQNETPGLGAKIAETDFQNRFERKTFEELDNIEGVTGATISSKAVIYSVKQKVQEVKGLITNF